MMEGPDMKLVIPCAERRFILGCWNVATDYCIPRRQCPVIHQACHWGIFCLSNSLSSELAHARKSQTSFESGYNVSFFLRCITRTEVFRIQHKLVGSTRCGGEKLGDRAIYVFLPHSGTHSALAMWPEWKKSKDWGSVVSYCGCSLLVLRRPLSSLPWCVLGLTTEGLKGLLPLSTGSWCV
jgi:hypothetical protein